MPDDPQDEVQQPVLIVIRKTPDATAAAPAAPAPDAPDVPAVASADVPAADPNPPQTQATDFLSIVTQAGLTAAGLFSGDGDGAPSAPGQEQPATDSNAAEGLNFANFFAIFGALETLQGLVANLLASPDVAAAYIQPVPELPVWDAPASGSGGATGPAPSGATPDFSAHQGYLNPAPEGIDALYAWTCAGGKGAGVQIIDIEGGWQVSHEDLAQNQGGIIGGAAFTGQHWVDHGTAVLGEFSGDDNGFGVTGICPDATVSMISHRTATPAVQIKLAADKLNAGDILLLEMHQPGPAYNFQSRDDQLGYIAVEFWPDIWASIKYATNKGIIVIEAAGNGAQNFDDPIYNTAPTGWPAGWTNPFARGSYDSGAILVGAGSPPPTTHGKDQVPGGGNLTTDRARLSFSNYGAAVDVQAWGLEVTSTGYGDLQGGADQNLWYTDTFGGTSGASPIVVGAVGCMQGVRKAASLAVLTPDQVRNIFRTTGSPQQDGVFGAATQNIGNRPDLKAILPLIVSTIYNANDGVTPASDGTAVA